MFGFRHPNDVLVLSKLNAKHISRVVHIHVHGDQLALQREACRCLAFLEKEIQAIALWVLPLLGVLLHYLARRAVIVGHGNAPRLQFPTIVQHEERVRVVTVHVHVHIAPVMLAHSPETSALFESMEFQLIHAVCVLKLRHVEISTVVTRRRALDVQTIANIARIVLAFFSANCAWLAEIGGHPVHDRAVHQRILGKQVRRISGRLTRLIKR
mmetsp:Transcript_58019/g.96212  ORF Transcript_58019/g.96212 Transcript_58019/m.96212 type:complete len:212 (-) Transcript_58019:350-985(-)